MYPLLETIRFEAGIFYNLPAHQQRLNQARKAIWKCHDELVLKDCLHAPVGLLPQQRYKCRIVYEHQVKEVTFEPYKIRPIRSLQLIEANDIDYQYKYQNRTRLAALFAQRGKYDDVLITQKGYLTDTYYCNLAAWNGQQWLTPATPLLAGTQRALLLNKGVVSPAKIHKNDLPTFEKLALFNAMIDWEDRLEVLVENISND